VFAFYPSQENAQTGLEIGVKYADMRLGAVMSFEVPSKMPPRLESVPAFPSVVMKLLSLLADGESSFSSIAACIATDPVLSGRLIARANAADQPSYIEARNVLQATLALGLDRTREISLVIATSVYAHSAIQSEILRPCWHHTLACALAASEIARQCGLRPAEPYTAALLHDIGRFALLAAYPAEYEEIMAGADGEPDDLIRMERERFGVDHVEAGLWLARRWNLPESIVEVIGRHHEAPTGALDQVTVVQVGCRFADLLGFSVNRPTRPPNLDEISATLPEWVRKRLGAQIRPLQDAIAREILFFAGAEAPPLGSPGVIVDDAEPDERPSTCRSPHDVPRQMPSLGSVLAAIALLLAAAVLFVQR
jgi:putative nucleotidyltransferase with HDIG domain